MLVVATDDDVVSGFYCSEDSYRGILHCEATYFN
jgi:hypothetical protein